MACQVFHPTFLPGQLRIDALRGEILQLLLKHMKALKSDITQEDFYEDHKILPGVQSVFDFKKQMNHLVLLFKLADKIQNDQVDVGGTLNICRAVVVARNQPSAHFMGWGQETVSSVTLGHGRPPQS